MAGLLARAAAREKLEAAVDLKKLGNILAVGGAVVLVAALVWWFTFYSSVVREFSRATGSQGEGSVFEAMSCLYSSSGMCAVVTGIAALAGRTAYEPLVFWVGAVALVVGVLIRVTAKPAGTA